MPPSTCELAAAASQHGCGRTVGSELAVGKYCFKQYLPTARLQPSAARPGPGARHARPASRSFTGTRDRRRHFPGTELRHDPHHETAAPRLRRGPGCVVAPCVVPVRAARGCRPVQRRVWAHHGRRGPCGQAGHGARHEQGLRAVCVRPMRPAMSLAPAAAQLPGRRRWCIPVRPSRQARACRLACSAPRRTRAAGGLLPARAAAVRLPGRRRSRSHGRPGRR
jgi:hypothetical protein